MNIHIHRMSQQRRGTRSYLEPKRRQQKTRVLGHQKGPKRAIFHFAEMSTFCHSNVHFFSTQMSIFFSLKCPFSPLKCPSPFTVTLCYVMYVHIIFTAVLDFAVFMKIIMIVIIMSMTSIINTGKFCI